MATPLVRVADGACVGGVASCLQKQWQHDLAVQMEEQRRAREARMAYDAAYAEIEKRQLQRSAVKEAREQAVLKAKMDKVRLPHVHMPSCAALHHT